MLQTPSPSPRPRRRALRWLRRAALALLAAYLLLAVLPYAFPPKAPALAEDWLAQSSTDENVDCATLLETGQEALDIRLRLIASARESLRIGTYIYAMDETGTLVTSALLDAAERGVQIRIIIDGLIGPVNLKNAPEIFALGSHPNVEIRLYNPVNLLRPWTLNARYHEKFFVADDEWLILGGRNIADEFLSQEGNPLYNYDQDIFLHKTGEGVSACDQVAAYFDRMWDSPWCATAYAGDSARAREAAGRLRDSWRDYAAAHDLTLDMSGFVPVRRSVLITGDIAPMPKAPVVYEKLLDLMGRAEERVILQSPYFVMDASMRDGLARICAMEMDMTIFTNSAATGNNIMASADGVFHRAMLGRMDAQVLEVHGDYSMHTKAILMDGHIGVYGSFNVDPRSAYIDTELMLAVDSPELTALLETYMDTLLAQSVPVNAAAAAVYPPAETKQASFGKMAAIYLLSPFVSLFRFLA